MLDQTSFKIYFSKKSSLKNLFEKPQEGLWQNKLNSFSYINAF